MPLNVFFFNVIETKINSACMLVCMHVCILCEGESEWTTAVKWKQENGD